VRVANGAPGAAAACHEPGCGEGELTPAAALPTSSRGAAKPFRSLVPVLAHVAVQLGASATQRHDRVVGTQAKAEIRVGESSSSPPVDVRSDRSATTEEVKTMAKKDDGRREIKKGKESER
jgi:hypothetical protein